MGERDADRVWRRPDAGRFHVRRRTAGRSGRPCRAGVCRPRRQVAGSGASSAGIDRARAYVTNAVKHFKFEPRGKRRLHKSPNAGEITACRWWLDQELSLVRPKLVIALGASALFSLTGLRGGLLKMRGTTVASERAGEVFVTVHSVFHPALRRRPRGRLRRFRAGFANGGEARRLRRVSRSRPCASSRRCPQALRRCARLSSAIPRRRRVGVDLHLVGFAHQIGVFHCRHECGPQRGDAVGRRFHRHDIWAAERRLAVVQIEDLPLFFGLANERARGTPSLFSSGEPSASSCTMA